MIEKHKPNCKHALENNPLFCAYFVYFSNFHQQKVEIVYEDNSVPTTDNNEVNYPGKCNRLEYKNGHPITPCPPHSYQEKYQIIDQKTNKPLTNPAFSPDNQ